MTWRKDTLSERLESRHFHSGWIDEVPPNWTPENREPVPFDWLGFCLGVLCFALLAVSLALAIGELAIG